MAFSGWLIKFGDVVLPNSFILADGWESTPNQRVEIDAYRDANVLLHRETSKNYKTSLKLNIRRLDLKEMRTLAVKYWNDETLEYKYAEMYMPDVTYMIHNVNEEKKDIEYNSFTIELIEY